MPSHRLSEAKRFEAYLERMSMAVGHADRREPLRAYLSGLLLPGERKSVEPMAARIDPLHVRARHQSLHHFVAQAPWLVRCPSQPPMPRRLATRVGDGRLIRIQA